MKYLVKDCDPNTGEPDDDGYDDEYVVCDQLSKQGKIERYFVRFGSCKLFYLVFQHLSYSFVAVPFCFSWRI